MFGLANDFFEDLAWVVGAAIVAMAGSHIVVSSIPLLFACVPMNGFPAFAYQAGEGVARRKSYTNAETSLAASRIRLHEVMLMAEFQGRIQCINSPARN